jgi:hypothetical protein
MHTFFQKPHDQWSDLEKRAFNEVQEIYERHDGDAEARYGAWEAMVWLSSQLDDTSYISRKSLEAEINKQLIDYEKQQDSKNNPEYEQGAMDALYNLKLKLSLLQKDHQ